jgi:RNA polymerase sigma-70 factor (ECF subfamily)
MRKNWLAATTWGRRFRAEPLVPDVAFQDESEPYPGHWRRFPVPWPAAPVASQGMAVPPPWQRAALRAALAGLPGPWRRVVAARAAAGGDDPQVAEDLGLTVKQERDILARARAAVRDQLDQAAADGPR